MQKLYPLKFNEIYKKYIWGGKGLEEFGKNPSDNFVAESWEIACHKDGMSDVAMGTLKGKKLDELIRKYRSDLVGTNVDLTNDIFPLLVKFINAKKKLSVQVHPCDEYASINEGDKGKNEAWVILSAKKNTELIIGLKKGITKNIFKKAIDSNRVESCLNKIKVRAGDIINIPVGLIHAIGEGIILAEIHQNSNVTYRVHDYDRKDSESKTRPLHIKKALDVIDFTSREQYKKTKGIEVAIGSKGSRNIYVVNKYFCVETYSIEEEIKQAADGTTFLIYIFIKGEGYIHYDKNKIYVSKGDTYLIPANLGEFNITGSMNFIKTYVPDIDKDIIKPLLNIGYSNKQINENFNVTCPSNTTDLDRTHKLEHKEQTGG